MDTYLDIVLAIMAGAMALLVVVGVLGIIYFIWETMRDG